MKVTISTKRISERDWLWRLTDFYGGTLEYGHEAFKKKAIASAAKARRFFIAQLRRNGKTAGKVKR